MKQVITIITLLIVSLAAAAQDTVSMTLDSCLRYAFGNNLQVLTARLNRESAEVNLSGARERFLPSVSASANQTLMTTSDAGRGGQASINGSLMLFDGLSSIHNLKQSRMSADQSELKVRQTQQSVSVQIVQAYLTILMNEEKLAYQQEVLETSRQQQLEGEVKYQVGRILESDYLLLQANYTSAQSEIDNTRLTIENDRYLLNKLLNIGNDTVIAVVPSTDTATAASHSVPPRDSVLAQARRTMPEWRISEMDVELARLNLKLAGSSFMPSLSLNAGYGGQWLPADVVEATPGTSTFSDNGTLTLGLNIPIFDRGSSSTQYKQSKISLQQAELQHRQTLVELEDQLDELHITTCQALNRYRSTEALSEAYRASYEVYVLKYGEGAVTTVEMLQQQDRYLSALNDYLQSKYSYILAEKQLDIYTGKEIKL